MVRKGNNEAKGDIMKTIRELIVERIAWFDENEHSWRREKGWPLVTSKVDYPKPVEEMTDEELLKHFEHVVLTFEQTKLINCLPDH